MQKLTNLTDGADQLMTIVPIDGTSPFSLEMIYRAGIQRWEISIGHPSLTLNGWIVTTYPNILRPWKNIVPFGIAVLSVNGLDPLNLRDFLDGTCTVNILSAAEVALVESQILRPIPLVNP